MTAQSRTTWLTTRRAAYAAQLAIAEAAYSDGLAKLKSYNFTSGDGQQAAVRQDVDKLAAEIDRLVVKIEQIDARLHGGGVLGLSVQRWQT